MALICNLLVVLDAVLTERSITRAAERIHLSQPASSGALARLREFFKDELLVQVGHKMVLQREPRVWSIRSATSSCRRRRSSKRDRPSCLARPTGISA